MDCHLNFDKLNSSVKTPQESRVIMENKTKVLADGGELTLDNCPMLPQTAERMQEMLNICHFYAVSYPQQVSKAYIGFKLNVTNSTVCYTRLKVNIIKKIKQLKQLFCTRIHQFDLLHLILYSVSTFSFFDWIFLDRIKK